MTSRALFITAVLLPLLCGCATSFALVDLVFPSPIQSARVEGQSDPRWIAAYGRDPRYWGRIPTRLWIEKSGPLETAARHGGCEHFVVIDGASTPPKKSDAPTHCKAWFPRSRDRILLYTAAGELIHEQRLPSEIPILEWRRWTWLPWSPVLDVLFVPLLVATAAGAAPFILLSDHH